MRTLKSTLAVVALALAFGAGRPVRAADPDPSAAAKAKKLIEKNETVFSFFAHPTPTLVNVEYGRPVGNAFGKGFTVTAKFNYKDGIPDRFWSKLEIEFDKDGDYVGTKAGTSSGLIGPLTASTLILDAFKDAIRNDPEVRKNKAVVDAVDSANIYALLKACLKRPE